MSELGVTMIPAGSAQAKGRIERLWGTLQDRLVQEFVLNGIKDKESANIFMKKYMPKFNRGFQLSPRENLSLESFRRVSILIIYSAGRPQESLTADQHFHSGENTTSSYLVENQLPLFPVQE